MPASWRLPTACADLAGADWRSAQALGPKFPFRPKGTAEKFEGLQQGGLLEFDDLAQAERLPMRV